MPRGDNLACGWAKAWVLTWNNPPPNAVHKLTESPGQQYTILGGETAPSTGTPHIQGYIRWARQKSFAQVKALAPSAHWERAKGDDLANFDYCSKKTILYESGERPQQGKRNDIHEVRLMLREGGTMEDVVNNATSLQAVRFGELFLRYSSPRIREERPIVKWIWGPTKTGKSYMAHQEAQNPWWSNKDLTWWEGYHGQKHVIIDDFRGSFCPLQELLRILDRYPYKVMYKGGSCELLATHIWITSCVPPEQAYPGCNERIDQLTRRIASVIHLTKQYEEPLKQADPALEPDG